MKITSDIKAVLADLDRILLVVVAILLLLYVLSGLFVIEANQKGVITRFGAVRAVVRPGIGYHLPWPVERVRKVNVKEVQSVEVGFYPDGSNLDELTPYCITGDRNIVHTRYTVKYRSPDPESYIMAGKRVREIVLTLAQATILEVLAEKEIVPVLTTEKRALESDIREKLGEKLSGLGINLQIVSVDGPPAFPPSLVKQAFQEVITSREEKRTRIHEADNYMNQAIPAAKAEANSAIETARAYKYDRISSAKGESDRFLKLLSEYEKSPSVTRHRLYLDTIEKVLPQVKIMVLATDDEGRPIKVKILQAPIPTTPRLMGQ